MEKRLKFSIAILLIGLMFISPTYSASSTASYNEKCPQIMGGPAHTGYYDGMGPEGNGTFLKTRLVGLDSGGEEWPPVIDEDSFYIPFSSWVIGGPDGKKNSVARYSRTDGSLIWKHEMDEQIWSGVHSLALYKNTVILSASKWAYYLSEPHDFLWGKIVALNKDTGDELWTYRIDLNTVSEIAVYSNKVFFATGGYWYAEGGYYAMCLDADTGKVVWQSEISNRISSAPSVSEDIAIYPSVDGMVYAFSVDAGTKKPLAMYPEGKLLWSKSLSDALQTLPIINASTVYLMSNHDGDVIALDLKSGKDVWRKNVGNPGGTGMCLGDGMIYAVFITKEFSEMCALQQKDGTVAWRMRAGTNVSLDNYPICCKNGIYINARNNTNNFIYRISLKGELLWRAAFNGSLANTGSIADGILYSVGYIGGWLYAFDGSGSSASINENLESGYNSTIVLSIVLIAAIATVIFLVRKKKVFGKKPRNSAMKGKKISTTSKSTL